MKSPAAKVTSRRSRFHATTGPKSASSGQYGMPNGQPPSTTWGSIERLEAVGIDPRCLAPSELMADEPEPIGRLEMISVRGLAVAGRMALGHELAAQPADGREGGNDGREREQHHQSPPPARSRHADGLCRTWERPEPAGGAPRSASQPGWRRLL